MSYGLILTIKGCVKKKKKKKKKKKNDITVMLMKQWLSSNG